jgi:peptidoglycan/LPS O-acetylase OafA/YrhL
MAALALPPAPLDPVPGTPKLSLVPPAAAAAASPAAPESRPARPRVRRLVVFTGRIS